MRTNQDPDDGVPDLRVTSQQALRSNFCLPPTQPLGCPTPPPPLLPSNSTEGVGGKKHFTPGIGWRLPGERLQLMHIDRNTFTHDIFATTATVEVHHDCPGKRLLVQTLVSRKTESAIRL